MDCFEAAVSYPSGAQIARKNAGNENGRQARVMRLSIVS
jgi:hypothetical protein